MVSKRVINNIIEKSVLTIVKCQDYPKALALKYYNDHKDDFQTEVYTTNNKVLPSPVGKLQSKQAKLQESVDYESLERGVAHDYSTNSYIPLNMMLNNVPDWEKKSRFMGVMSYDFGNGFIMPVLDSPNNDSRGDWVDMSMPQESEMLSNMIDKSPRVAEDTIVYRYGELPIDIQEGGHGVIKGFMSTTYNPYIAFEDIPNNGTWIQNEKRLLDRVRYKQRIFVMKGSKGMVLNEHTGCVDWQSELLLDKGMRYVVLSKDDVNMSADILVY